eukprot:SM000013S26425  [mRNA]  locus=s13:316029:319630:+ [translate_table: standard]
MAAEAAAVVAAAGVAWKAAAPAGPSAAAAAAGPSRRSHDGADAAARQLRCLLRRQAASLVTQAMPPGARVPGRSRRAGGAGRHRCTAAAVQELEPAVKLPQPRNAPRLTVRLALPSKGRMAEDCLELLKSCQLTVYKPNPRQYIADIKEMEGLEVWFQRASDVVRKLKNGDVDLGIVGYDMVREFGEDDSDLIVVHEALGFGACHLAIAVPMYGIFENITTLEELTAMPQWTAHHPLRIVTGYTYLGAQYLQEKGLKHVNILTADGALEAHPAVRQSTMCHCTKKWQDPEQMGTADAILDLVSSGTTLRENNLKELRGGRVLESQGVLVASRKALLERKGVMEATHELLERLEAHLKAKELFTVTANIRGTSEEEVAERILNQTSYPGLQGPTVSKVFTSTENGTVKLDYFALVVCVPKKQLYAAVRELRAAGGSGVLVSPLTYIFDEETPRWRGLLDTLRAGH